MTHLLVAALLFATSQASAPEASPRPPFVVERGERLPELRIPRGEKLVYRVQIGLGLVDPTVGTVTLSTGFEPFQESLLLSGTNGGSHDGSAGDTKWMRIHAKGDYAFYSMDALIETRVLPQEWPQFLYRQTQDGTEKRRREVRIGWRDGKRTSSYRKDSRKGAPKGTRVWRDPRYREVPLPTLDMLSAVYLIRTMVEEDLGSLRFPLIDKYTLWQMRLTRGERRRVETPAGTFDAVEIVLSPSTYPGEERDEEKAKKFEGLFGLHGAIQLWVHRETGVPVRIQGDLPLGPLTLGIDVELERFSGTPEAFQPVE